MTYAIRQQQVWQHQKIANTGGISDTLHSQVPSHHVQQKRLLEFKAPDW